MFTGLKSSPHILDLLEDHSLLWVPSSPLVYVQAAPSALASIGWKHYLIFIIITFLSTFGFAFVFPERKGRSFEELNQNLAMKWSECPMEDFTQLKEVMHNFNVNLAVTTLLLRK
jgi:hypothetical protein